MTNLTIERLEAAYNDIFGVLQKGELPSVFQSAHKIAMHGDTLKEALTTLIEAYKLPDDEWMPIESAPKDGTEILVKDNQDIINHVSWQGQFDGSWRMMSDTDLYLNPKFQTSWLRIPKPPEKR